MRICIDVGHGTDTWNKGGGKGVRLPDGSIWEEHTFNSKVSLAQERLFKHNGFKVDYSQRPFSPDKSLKERVAFINAKHRKTPYLLVISNHANASTNYRANGYGVFHHFGGGNSKKVADNWVKQAREILSIKPWGKGVWRCVPGTWSNFYMVRKTEPTAILIEHFFFTNKKERNLCDTEDYINRFAEITVRVVCDLVGKKFRPLAEDKEINWKELGHKFVIENGISDGTRPTEFVTRQELWSMLKRLNNLLK